MKIIFKFFILILIFFSIAYANDSYNYEILGNKRISDQTIINIIDFKKNKKYNVEDLNNFQKNFIIQIISAKFLLK